MSHSPRVTPEQYTALADFRYAIRQFTARSSDRARAEGLPPQQHQALLVIAASTEPRPTVGFLASRLLIAPNAAAELVKRLSDAGYVSVERDIEDRRRRVLAVTPAAQTLLDRLSEAHLAEIGELAPRLVRALRTIAARTLE